MSSPGGGSSVKDILLEIPSEQIANGKTLLIENYFELVVDGCHLSKPAKFIKHVHQLCLVDTQEQDNHSITSTHQLIPDVDPKQFVQIILEFPSEVLTKGKSIRIENQHQLQANLEDFFTETKDILIQLPKDYFQRGKIIRIAENQIKSIDADGDGKGGKDHLAKNPFAKRDHLLSKKMMEMTIELLPEYFLQGQTLTFAQEDPQSIAAHFPYHRQSKPHLPIANDLNASN